MSTRNLAEIADLVEQHTEGVKQFEARYSDRLEKLEVRLDSPHLTPGNTGKDLRNSKEFGQFLRSGKADDLRNMSYIIGTNEDGGYLHVRTLDTNILAAVGEINPLMNEVRKVNISSNEYRQVFTTSRNATARAAEGDTRSETSRAKMVVSDVTLYDLFAYPQVSNELLHGTDFDISGWLINDIAETFSEALGTEFISGNGTKQSVGLLNSTSTLGLGDSPELPWGSLYSLTASPSVVSYDMLLSAITKLPIRYKQGGNAKWFMSTSAIEATRGLKDSNGLPIWRQDFGIAGAPMVLLGYPVVEVPQLENASHSILFGDMMQAYAFVQNTRGVGLLIDQITAPGYTKFYSTMQCAGGVMDSRAMVALAV